MARAHSKLREASGYVYFVKYLHRSGMSVYTLHVVAQRTLTRGSGQQKDDCATAMAVTLCKSGGEKGSHGCFSGVDQQSPAECRRWSGPQSPQGGTHSTVQKGPAT